MGLFEVRVKCGVSAHGVRNDSCPSSPKPVSTERSLFECSYLRSVSLLVQHRALYHGPWCPNTRHNQESWAVGVALAFQLCLVPARCEKAQREEDGRGGRRCFSDSTAVAVRIFFLFPRLLSKIAGNTEYTVIKKCVLYLITE